jgi:hypothetical protein
MGSRRVPQKGGIIAIKLIRVSQRLQIRSIERGGNAVFNASSFHAAALSVRQPPGTPFEVRAGGQVNFVRCFNPATADWKSSVKVNTEVDFRENLLVKAASRAP